MRWTASVVAALKIALFTGGVVGLAAFWHSRPAGVPALPDDDDLETKPMVTVRVGKVTRQTLRAYVNVQGIVEPAAARADHPAAAADVSSPTSAMVATVDCIEGQTVKRGQSLFHLDGRAAESAVARAQSVSDAADSLVQSAETDKAVDRDVLRFKRDAAVAAADLETAKRSLTAMTITSPIEGTITRLNVNAGDTAVAGTRLVQVVDLGSLIVNCSIPMEKLPAVHIGQPAQLEMPTGPVETTVVFIDPSVDPSTGTGSVDVSIPASAKLLPGQSIAVRIIAAEDADCLVVPSVAVTIDEHGQAFVSLTEQDFQWARRHPVTVGLRDRDYTEVSGSGIADGADVVTNGTFALTELTQIRVAR